MPNMIKVKAIHKVNKLGKRNMPIDKLRKLAKNCAQELNEGGKLRNIEHRCGIDERLVRTGTTRGSAIVRNVYVSPVRSECLRQPPL